MIQVVQLDAGLAIPCGGYKGEWTREGNLAMCLSGGFPADRFVPVLIWTADTMGQLTRERFWPIYEKSEDVELRYRAWSMKPGSEDVVTAPVILFESTAKKPDCVREAEIKNVQFPPSPGREMTQTGGAAGTFPGKSPAENRRKECREGYRYWIILEVKGCGKCAGGKDSPQDPGAPSPMEGMQSPGTGGSGKTQYLRVGPIHLYVNPEIHIHAVKPEERGSAGAGPEQIRPVPTSGGKADRGADGENLRVKIKRMEPGAGSEIVTFLRAGNSRPPLRIIFAGTKPSSLELALQAMRAVHTPCLVLADTRLGGEGFFLGSESYENAVMDVIHDTLEELAGFTWAQVVLSGVSFGAAAAIYYGARYGEKYEEEHEAKLSPRAILLVEPILSTGTMALDEKFGRNGSFPLSLDLFLMMKHDFGMETCSEVEAVKQAGKQRIRSEENSADDAEQMKTHHRRVSREERDAKAMDGHIWEQIQKENFSPKEIAVVCMKEDEFDAGAYGNLMNLFGMREPSVRISGRVCSGRHIAEDNEMISQLTEWLERRYEAIEEEMTAAASDAASAAGEMKK